MQVGGDRGGEEVVQASALLAAGFARRQQPLDEPVAVIGLGAVAGASPLDGVSERAF
ncbi:MAG: hypothetical protein ACR2LK_09595 [Solirubrobacteraceae bacterium]